MEISKTVGGPRNMPSTATVGANDGEFAIHWLKPVMSGPGSPTKVVQTSSRGSLKTISATAAGLITGASRPSVDWCPGAFVSNPFCVRGDG